MELLAYIKKVKKEKNLTNETLSSLSGISVGTLNKLLSGASADPKISTVIALCDALGITLDEATGRAKATSQPQKNETIRKYMALDAEGRRRADALIKDEYARVLREEQTSTYSLDAPNIRSLRLYNISVSAGTGSYLSSSDFTEISLYSTPVTDEADFAVKVYGDSMLPRYSSGDILLIKSAKSVDVGEFGIFSVDGESFVKKFGGDRLVSLNPEYSDIKISDFNELICFGKVIGKLKK